MIHRISNVDSVKVIEVIEVISLGNIQGKDVPIVEYFDSKTGRRLGRSYPDDDISAFMISPPTDDALPQPANFNREKEVAHD